MKKTFVLLSLFLFGLMLLSGCTIEKNTNNDLKINDILLNNESASKIVTSLYLEKPVFTMFTNFNKENFIFSCVKNKYFLLKEFAKTWQTVYESSSTPEINYGCYSDNKEDYELFVAENDLFGYFVTLSQGSASGSAYFNVYSYKDNKVYTIEAYGPHGSYNDITISEGLKQGRKDILDYLENKISKSEYVYHQKTEDLDMSLQQNAVRDWQIDNRLPRTNNDINLTIRKFKSTKIENFFGSKISKDYIDESKWDFENKYYKITSYFKGVIFCLDKITNEYFVLFVPDDLYNWVETIEFKDDYIIVLYERMENKPNYEINLKNLTIKKLTK